MRRWYYLVALVFLLAVAMAVAGGCGQPEFHHRDNDNTSGNNEIVHNGHEDDSNGRLIVDELEREIEELLDLLDSLDDFDESELDF